MNNLNKQIAMVVAVGQEPNDLRDQRDLLLDEIATYSDITVTEPGTNGKVSVAIGTQLLVDGGTDTVNALAIGAGGAATVGGNATTVTSGKLRGLIDLRDTIIGGANGYIAQLDTLAASVVTSVNARHSAGFGLDGSTGNAFFAGTTAATIALAAPILASVNTIAASDTAANVPGGADNAVDMAQLQYVVQTIGASTTTLDGFYGQMVAKIGTDTDQASRLPRGAVRRPRRRPEPSRRGERREHGRGDVGHGAFPEVLQRRRADGHDSRRDARDDHPRHGRRRSLRRVNR